MHSDQHPAFEIASPVPGLAAPEMSALLSAKGREIIRLRRQIAWIQRQIFCQKSERRMPEPECVRGTLRADHALSCPPAPVGVLDGCRADVSFIAGMIIDKFAFHQPLHRQDVKLQDSGINVSRAWITKLMPAAVSLIEPIFNAQLESVRRSRVIAMDETPIEAGRAGPGKMKAAYFWPVVGDHDEICFLYYPSRAAKHVETALGLQRPHGAILHSAGYSRQEQSKPVLERFCAWIDAQFDKQKFLQSSPFPGALAYIRERRVGLSVYLDDPEVSIDPNHLERALRVIPMGIPMGKQNWLFSWTELGAKHIGIVRSLLATCRLHDINPYDYFMDAVQHVGQHPASLGHSCINSRHESERRCLPPIRYGRTFMT